MLSLSDKENCLYLDAAIRNITLSIAHDDCGGPCLHPQHWRG